MWAAPLLKLLTMCSKLSLKLNIKRLRQTAICVCGFGTICDVSRNGIGKFSIHLHPTLITPSSSSVRRKVGSRLSAHVLMNCVSMNNAAGFRCLDILRVGFAKPGVRKKSRSLMVPYAFTVYASSSLWKKQIFRSLRAPSRVLFSLSFGAFCRSPEECM